jgi:HD-GYP domain-containing protein (c-di-GMP phosphodiesterase class II)
VLAYIYLIGINMLLADNPLNDSPKDTGQFTPIALAGLGPTSILSFDLFLSPIGNEAPMLYRNHNCPLTQEDLDRLIERSVLTLYIRNNDEEAYQSYLQTELIQNEQISPTRRYTILREATRATFEVAYHNKNLDRTMQVVSDFGEQLVQLLTHEDLVLSEMLSLINHDFYTFTHLVNVCTYSVILAKSLGISNPADLNFIALGAMLHDIGKRKIEHGILCKPGKLDDYQRNIMQRHPKIGFETLCLQEKMNWGALMMVYQHHEHMNGSGYPVGLTGNDIHPWARLASIVDVTDALTSKRPYRKPFTLDLAVEYLNDKETLTLDMEMMKCWTKTIQACC